jgi:DNA-binding transcriptional MocR family regulator
MTDWRPRLSAGPNPLYRRLADAIVSDITTGKLKPGARLPPHRSLAHTLSISIGAVTRGYDEAARRGVIQGHVGRGSYVVDRTHSAMSPGGPIDLSMNIAPLEWAKSALTDTLTSARRMNEWTDRLGYAPPAGYDADRRAGAAWLARTARTVDLDWRNLICCTGAQTALALSFMTLCKPGDTILCEAATFSGVKAIAARFGYKLKGVEMDSEGLRPDSLARAAASGARVVYTLPKLQNPTTRTMGQKRRDDIVRVARKHDLWIVEDDVYAIYARELDILPLASIAPERTFYVSSLSKSLAPGLRAGFLVAPTGDMFGRTIEAVMAINYATSGLGSAIATHWIESGKAYDIARDVRDEMQARTAAALNILGRAIEKPRPNASLHLWLPMPEIDAERVAGRALRGGVRLTSPSAHSVEQGSSAAGLRVCIGGAQDRAALERGLCVLKAAMSGETQDLARTPL